MREAAPARATDPQAQALPETALARAMLAFYLRPSRHADPGWLRVRPPSPDPAAWAAVDHALAREHALAGCFAEPQTHAARCFLIERPALQALVLALGVAAHGPALRRVVRGSERAALTQRLGDALEAAWSQLARVVPPAAAASAEGNRDFYAAAGWTLALQCLHATDPGPANRRRARLCAPPGLPPAAPLPRPGATALLAALREDALPRWAPAWTGWF